MEFEVSYCRLVDSRSNQPSCGNDVKPQGRRGSPPFNPQAITPCCSTSEVAVLIEAPAVGPVIDLAEPDGFA